MVSLLDGSFFNYKANIEEFVSKTDATPKMGIRHKNWGIKKESYYAPLDVSPTGLTNNDYIFKHVLSTYGKEKMHLASKIGQNYENNKYYNYSAFHFDGNKVGKFFKEECVKDGVKVYDSVVQKANITEQENIKSIVLDDGYILESDLFIDCTGFSRLLMKSIGTEWVSKKDVLLYPNPTQNVIHIKSEFQFDYGYLTDINGNLSKYFNEFINLLSDELLLYSHDLVINPANKIPKEKLRFDRLFITKNPEIDLKTLKFLSSVEYNFLLKWDNVNELYETGNVDIYVILSKIKGYSYKNITKVRNYLMI
jgi:hypothetical protein